MIDNDIPQEVEIGIKSIVSAIVSADLKNLPDIRKAVLDNDGTAEEKVSCLALVAGEADKTLAGIESEIRKLTLQKGQIEARREILREVAETVMVSENLVGEKFPGIQWRKFKAKVELDSKFNHENYRKAHPELYVEVPAEFKPDLKRLKEHILESIENGVGVDGAQKIPEGEKLYLL